jgi:NAD+ synthase
MPEKNVTPRKDLYNVRSMAKTLNIRYKEIDIERGKKYLLNNPVKDKLAGGNFSARIRMALLYYYAAINNLLVLGTADKSELMLGYFTKFGDAGADIFPIGELYKSQVRLLGKELKVPEQILQQPSSPGFWRGQLAEKEIGLPYEEIDKILESYLQNRLNRTKYDQRKIKLVIDMMKKNQHKKEDMPICNPF